MAYDIPVSSQNISVTLAVGLAAYQKTLASAVLRAGMLRRLFDLSPWRDIHIEESDGRGSLKRIKRFPVYKFSNRAVWGIWRRIPAKLRPGPPAEFSVRVGDRLMANWIEPSTIFHGVTASCLATMRVAKRQGAITMLEIGARHPRHWQQAIAEERRRFGINESEGGRVFSESMIRRMDREFQTCDKIALLSSAARRSFEEFGYGPKAVVVEPGIDHEFFTPSAEREPSDVFRICYVGRVELAKGVGYLVQAWKRLALPHAELLLIGTVEPDMKAMLKECAGAGVKLAGFLPRAQLAQRYRESDVFVFPSVNEGFGLVLLEAMASGLPIIAAEGTGADECVTEEKEGFIVPARNVDALADAISWCYHHRDDLQLMGRAARARIESNFTLEHYNQRVIALYRVLAGK